MLHDCNEWMRDTSHMHRGSIYDMFVECLVVMFNVWHIYIANPFLIERKERRPCEYA